MQLLDIVAPPMLMLLLPWLVASAGFPDAAARPLATVVVLTCNRPRAALHALHQIEVQDYRPLEALVVDDGNRTAEALLRAEYPHLQITREDSPTPRDGGHNASGGFSVRLLALSHLHSIGGKRSAAVRAARGDVVLHWDDDDLFEPHRVSAQVEPIYGGVADITVLPVSLLALMPHLEVYAVTSDRAVLWSSLAYRTSLARELAFADVSLADDLDFAERAVSSCRRFVIVDDVQSIYMRHVGGGPQSKQSFGVDEMVRSGALSQVSPPQWLSLSAMAAAAAAAEADASSGSSCGIGLGHWRTPKSFNASAPTMLPWMPARCCSTIDDPICLSPEQADARQLLTSRSRRLTHLGFYHSMPPPPSPRPPPPPSPSPPPPAPPRPPPPPSPSPPPPPRPSPPPGFGDPVAEYEPYTACQDCRRRLLEQSYAHRRLSHDSNECDFPDDSYAKYCSGTVGVGASTPSSLEMRWDLGQNVDGVSGFELDAHFQNRPHRLYVYTAKNADLYYADKGYGNSVRFEGCDAGSSCYNTNGGRCLKQVSMMPPPLRRLASAHLACSHCLPLLCRSIRTTPTRQEIAHLTLAPCPTAPPAAWIPLIYVEAHPRAAGLSPTTAIMVPDMLMTSSSSLRLGRSMDGSTSRQRAPHPSWGIIQEGAGRIRPQTPLNSLTSPSRTGNPVARLPSPQATRSRSVGFASFLGASPIAASTARWRSEPQG